MIAFVRGTVASVSLNAAILDVGGVGYQVMCTPGTSLRGTASAVGVGSGSTKRLTPP